MSFIARYPGECGECGDKFGPGAEICFIDNVLVMVHKHHPKDFEEIGLKPEDVCRRCFMVHAGECL